MRLGEACSTLRNVAPTELRVPWAALLAVPALAAIALAAPTAAAAVIGSFDFDSDAQGWTATGARNDWQHGSSTLYTAHSGNRVWGTILNGNYRLGSDSRLLSPPMSTYACARDARVTWWAVNDYGADQPDEAKVQITTDDGASFTTAFTSSRWHSPWWFEHSAALPGVAGTTFRVRYLFEERTNGHVHTGWYVDDVVVTADLSACPPTAPLNLKASATRDPGRIVLSWDEPASSRDIPVTGYVVHRATAASGPYAPIARLGDVRSFADAALAPPASYYYRVTAANAAGEGGPSAEASPFRVEVAPFAWGAPAIVGPPVPSFPVRALPVTTPSPCTLPACSRPTTVPARHLLDGPAGSVDAPAVTLPAVCVLVPAACVGPVTVVPAGEVASTPGMPSREVVGPPRVDVAPAVVSPSLDPVGARAGGTASLAATVAVGGESRTVRAPLDL